MKIEARLFRCLFTVFAMATFAECLACSMCKVTINGHSFLGSNEDSWRLGSRIWFENKTFGKFGAVYVGYGDGFPQGGMNEAGLAFDGLTIYRKPVMPDPAKKSLKDPTAFVKEIMQNCQSVDEVKAYAGQFNRTPFNASVLMFSDRSGKYLVIEPDTMISGSDSKYIIANFCPSNTSEDQKLDFARYKRGEVFLRNHPNDYAGNYCYALTDTMHECREKIGDGTMYSYVADLDKGELHLYFYHDFKTVRDFNLKEELAKGDHKFEMTSLFPPNAEYKRLTSFQTPQNNVWMQLTLLGLAVFLGFSSLFFLAGFLFYRRTIENRNLKLFLGLLSALLGYYCYVLIRNQPIFYFPSPYHDWKFSILNIAAYVPFALLLALIPVLLKNISVVRKSDWGKFAKFIFSLNSLSYLILIALFSYWKLYNVF